MHAKLYYESFKELQKGSDKPLRVGTIFSFAANEAQDAVGDIQDERFEVWPNQLKAWLAAQEM